MPSLEWNRRWALEFRRFARQNGGRYYGEQWGDPEISGLRYLLAKLRHGRRVPGNLSKVVGRYIRPYLVSGGRVVEVGAGGGRWTGYLLAAASEVIVVELNPEFFPYLTERFREQVDRLRFYRTSGYEMSGVATGSVDFVFTFGTLGHLEADGVVAYLAEIARILRPEAAATLHYADTSKPFFQAIPADERKAFGEMDGDRMEELVADQALEIVHHDRSLLNHSGILVARKAEVGQA